jgi:hypothetical protein
MDSLIVYSSLYNAIYDFLSGKQSPLEFQQIVFAEWEKLQSFRSACDNRLVQIVEMLRYNVSCVDCECYCHFCGGMHDYKNRPADIVRCITERVREFLSKFMAVFPRDQLSLETIQSLPEGFIDDYNQILEKVAQGEISLKEAHLSLCYWTAAVSDEVLARANFVITLAALRHLK